MLGMKTLPKFRMESKISFDFPRMTHPKMLERQQIITPQMSTPYLYITKDRPEESIPNPLE